MCLSIFAKIQFGRTFFPLLFCVDFVTDGSCRKWKMSSSSSNSILRCDICEKKWDGYVISNDWKTINIPKNTGKFYEQIIWLHTTVIRTTKTGSTNMRENISVKKPEKAHDYADTAFSSSENDKTESAEVIFVAAHLLRSNGQWQFNGYSWGYSENIRKIVKVTKMS